MKLFVFVIICFSTLPVQAKYGGGTGEPNEPYLIFDANQMNAIGAEPNDWDKCFKLMADVDLSAYTGTEFNIIGVFVGYNDPSNKPFTGIFDGNGYTISNFTYDYNGVNYIGLFGYVTGEIKDLGLIAPEVNAGTCSRVGSLVGYIYRGTITNCYSEAGSVSGDWYIGGLVGYNGSGDISNCYSTGSVTGDNYVGGLVGYNAAGEYFTGTISNCYSTDSVEGGSSVGGLVGENQRRDGDLRGVYFYGIISNCYSTGSVTGDDDVGGLVGVSYGGVTFSFWDIETSGQSTSARGTGLPTVEMQDPNTYIRWGCELVWTINKGKDYPRLWWENKPGEPIIEPSYGGGSGEPNDPYLIYTADQFNTIGLIPCHLDKHFLLRADIDLAGYTGTSFNIIGEYVGWRRPNNKPFTGVFDGSGHTISNFSNSRGLFGYVTGEIKDLGLIYPDVDAGTGNDVGSMVGQLSGGTVTGCYAEGGIVSGNWYVGMSVGW